jgi:hypothetical protein
MRFHKSADGVDCLKVERIFWHEPMPEFRRTQ